jgi:cell division transport system permease protein
MLRALKYCFTEAAASLWRSWRSAGLAVLTIAAGLFVLGFFLFVNANLQRVTDRWSQAAELSIYLSDGITQEQLRAINDQVDRSGLVVARQYVSKADAAARFREDFPDLAPTVSKLDGNPLPASVEVRLRPDARAAAEAVDLFAVSIARTPGVADVRYDRRLLDRLNGAIGIIRGIGLAIVVMLSAAAALTVANVVRLAAHARRDEIEIMQLVGAPLAYVRGPFVAEGILQGGLGAVIALVALWMLFLLGKGRYGHTLADALGATTLTFLPAELWVPLVLGGMALGCLGGLVVARHVR